MSRQDANAAFARTSFLYGGNAAYIEDLYARYETDPKSVDAEWQAFFQSLKDERGDVIRSARGASWKAAGLADPRQRGELVAALDGDWSEVERAIGDKVKAKAQPRVGRDLPRRRPAGDARFGARADARFAPTASAVTCMPTSIRSGSSRAGTRRSSTRAATASPRPTSTARSSSTTCSASSSAAARDRRHAAPHLLPDARHRVHAHLGSGTEGLDPGARRGARQGGHVHARGQARHPRQADRGRRLREVLRRQVDRHQALRPRRRRIADPGARADRQARRRARRRGDRDRHGASRAPQRARERDAQAVPRASSTSSRAAPPRPTTSTARATSSITWARRPTASSTATRPPLAHRQPVAPRDRRSGRARQGARQAGPARRHAASIATW